MNKEIFMNDLIKHLVNKGMSEAEAQKLADGFTADSVEVDALSDAIQALSKAMNTDNSDKLVKGKKVAKEEDEDDSMDGSSSEDMFAEQSMDEDDEDNMHKALESMAKGTDMILENMDKQYKAMMKALDACLKEMKGMKNVNGKVEEMEKSINKALLAPIPPRAVNFSAVPYTEPAQAKTTVTRGDVISKAMNMIQSDSTDMVRKSQLFTAISKLESGVDAIKVAQDYNIDLSK